MILLLIESEFVTKVELYQTMGFVCSSGPEHENCNNYTRKIVHMSNQEMKRRKESERERKAVDGIEV